MFPAIGHSFKVAPVGGLAPWTGFRAFCVVSRRGAAILGDDGVQEAALLIVAILTLADYPICLLESQTCEREDRQEPHSHGQCRRLLVLRLC